LFTAALWIASVAYTQTHISSVQTPDHEPTTAEGSYNNQEFSRLSEPIEKTPEAEEPKQIEQPTPKSHPQHFEPPQEPKFNPDEDLPFPEHFYIVQNVLSPGTA